MKGNPPSSTTIIPQVVVKVKCLCNLFAFICILFVPDRLDQAQNVNLIEVHITDVFTSQESLFLSEILLDGHTLWD